MPLATISIRRHDSGLQDADARTCNASMGQRCVTGAMQFPWLSRPPPLSRLRSVRWVVLSRYSVQFMHRCPARARGTTGLGVQVRRRVSSVPRVVHAANDATQAGRCRRGSTWAATGFAELRAGFPLPGRCYECIFLSSYTDAWVRGNMVWDPLTLPFALVAIALSAPPHLAGYPCLRTRTRTRIGSTASSYELRIALAGSTAMSMLARSPRQHPRLCPRDGDDLSLVALGFPTLIQARTHAGRRVD